MGRFSKPDVWVATRNVAFSWRMSRAASYGDRGYERGRWRVAGKQLAFGAFMKAYLTALSALVGALAVPLAAAPTQRALLIGINTYQPAGTRAEHPAGCIYGRCELGAFQNLDGSVNDAQAMADLLASPKFGFPAGQVVLLTNPAPPQPRPGVVVLPADQTTHDGILAAMQKYLVNVPQKGDTVVFYDASHGSLRVNSKGNKLTVLVNGQYVHADSTLVPSDAYKGGYDVRDREMSRIFNAALDKGIHLTVIFDSCHSGGISRGIGPKYRERALAFDPRDINEAPDTRPVPTERQDNPALVFSAAQQDQTAKEMPLTGGADRGARGFHGSVDRDAAGYARRHTRYARLRAREGRARRKQRARSGPGSRRHRGAPPATSLRRSCGKIQQSPRGRPRDHRRRQRVARHRERRRRGCRH